MIVLDHVSFTYREGEPDAVPALRDLDLTIEPGQFVAVIGHNGSGKSTLVKLLTAVLYPPTEGEVRIEGIPVRHETRWEIRRRVSVVFQDPDDQLVMNRVGDDVAFGPENLGLPREEIAERVDFALGAMGLGELAERMLDDLSLGQKQRVAIAGALAMRPRFLILDEPTSLLPVAAAMSLIRVARDLNRREAMGVIHITHSMVEAALFDRVIVLDEGRMVLDGSPAEVFRHVDRLREIGLDVPLAASLAHRLRARGLPLEGDILTETDLREAIAALPRPMTVKKERPG
ncbi:MAG: energy-coupling factor transport system ATP-binding protein [Rubrobacteraceae bacterium]|nr:energy-coupling factor transport system ATP-binding protein [Rubrobacteraceae bacterium]